MAEVLEKKFYVNGGYLDDNMSVNNISELLEKESSNAFFLGQSVHMPEAFNSVNGIPYPIDFWSVPNGENIKWEIKSVPPIENEDDFSNFKEFIKEFYILTNYQPLSNGIEILVDNKKYIFNINENDEISWINDDEKVNEKVQDSINKVINGASESFDTLKEIEDWIKSQKKDGIDCGTF